MNQGGQGIVRDERGQEQPGDKARAQTVHRPGSDNAVSREATRDPRLTDAEKTPGAGTMPDNGSDNTTG